jgi:hypothetical protein
MFYSVAKPCRHASQCWCPAMAPALLKSAPSCRKPQQLTCRMMPGLDAMVAQYKHKQGNLSCTSWQGKSILALHPAIPHSLVHWLLQD